MEFSRKAALPYAALVVSLLARSAAAQNTNNNNNNLPNLSEALSSASVAATKTDDNTAAETGTARTTGKNPNNEENGPQTTRGGGKTAGVITGGGETNTATDGVPMITGGSQATDGGALPSGLPTLSGAFKIVPASVPPMANAPYMQSSTMPEGTVFIVVGAILGFLAMSVLLWRGLVAWSLHRSVKRAAQQQNMTDAKALFRTPAAPFYKYSDRDSTISLGGLGAKSNKKNSRPTTGAGLPGAASASSLFFSPTAGAANAGLQTAGNRGSNYLPAGYYAAGASAPANAQSHVSIGHGHGPSISMSNLRPDSQGYNRARSMGPSPPDSPNYHQHTRGMGSSSTLNLSRSYGGDERAPSAYLEDLFDGEGALPTPGQGVHRSSPGQNRF